MTRSDDAPVGYVPTTADFERDRGTMAAQRDEWPDLAIVDGELVHGRKVGDQFLIRPEEGEAMREAKLERRRDSGRDEGRERMPNLGSL